MTLLAVAACAAPPPGGDEEEDPPPPFGDVRFEQIVSGLSAPVAIANANDARLFVAERGGVIRIVEDGALLPTPFLDIRSQVATANEQGLVGLAFPPDYAASGAFYAYYSGTDGHGRLARFHRDPDNANLALSEPEVLIRLNEASQWHNGGQLAFGPDDYLYWAVGDAANPNLAQALSSLRGKLLRLNVSVDTGYLVPAGNPFVGTENARPEVWALGLRNPWRFSFDFEAGQLYIADVGQDAHEEVNVVPAATGGQNYGWPIMEGNSCYNASSCNRTGLTAPTFTYAHVGGGRSITGGYVYRGPSAPELVGLYVFADFMAKQVYAASANDAWRLRPLLPEGESITAATFGEGEGGRLYVADMYRGTLYEITQREP